MKSRQNVLNFYVASAPDRNIKSVREVARLMIAITKALVHGPTSPRFTQSFQGA